MIENSVRVPEVGQVRTATDKRSRVKVLAIAEGGVFYGFLDSRGRVTAFDGAPMRSFSSMWPVVDGPPEGWQPAEDGQWARIQRPDEDGDMLILEYDPIAEQLLIGIDAAHGEAQSAYVPLDVLKAGIAFMEEKMNNETRETK